MPRFSETPLTIGTVSGPVFGVYDLSSLETEDICHLKLLEQLPSGLLALSQVIVLFHPKQLKSHRCDNKNCFLAHTNLPEKPNVDYLCRAFFPKDGSYNRRWKEASISIGGSILAAKYLKHAGKSSDDKINFAFLNSQNKTWETLDVYQDDYDYYCATLNRHDFSAPDTIYRMAAESIPTKDMEDIASKISENLHSGLQTNEDNTIRSFAVTVFIDSGNQLKDSNSLKANYYFVPFLPIYVGELHNVVIVGEFLQKIIMQKNQSIITSYRAHFNLIENLKHMFNNTEIKQNILKYFCIVDSWKNEELLIDYPLKKSGGGWTFFKDTDPDDPVQSLFPHEFLTIEPGTPFIRPFGNSATGALACAIALDFLYPDSINSKIKYRGKTDSSSKPWGENLYTSGTSRDGKYLSIWKNEKGLWTIRAHPKLVGQFNDFS